MQGSAPGERRGGRQKGTKNKKTIANGGLNLVDLARKHTHTALDRLVALLFSEDEDMRYKASTALLDRGFGRPGQSMMLEGNPAKPIAIAPVRIEFVRSAESDE